MLDMHFYSFSSMITKHDGNHLIRALRTVAEQGPGHVLTGRFVSMNCRNEAESYCGPAKNLDAQFEASLDYKGKLYSNDAEFDYVQGEFGSWLDPFAKWETLVPSIGNDAHCCERSGGSVTNTTAMLCLRGECDFITKAETVEAAGAGMMILSSYNETLQRMGCDPPLRGRKSSVANIMVTSTAYDELVSGFYSNRDAGVKSIIRVDQQNVCEEGSR